MEPAGLSPPDMICEFARADTALHNIGTMLATPTAYPTAVFDTQMDALRVDLGKLVSAPVVPDVWDFMRSFMPANLREVERVSGLGAIVLADGIPLAHVPRGEIVTELLAAPDFTARRAVVEARIDDIVHDCETSLSEPVPPDDDRLRELGLRAIAAFRDGHYEAAQSLAVSVSEEFITCYVGSNHTEAKAAVKRLALDRSWYVASLNYIAALCVVPTLFASWKPTDKKPAPDRLSRHVTAHLPTHPHLNPVNAVIAIMQVASLLGAARWSEGRALTA
ncbi:hypothetical protein A5763_04395 [Mycolicibacterium fortuitum]|nr:hypothetical protein A5763_04395 [Mycolicibacterium fortuitum]